MYQDYKDLLSAFHVHGVKYLIVGGYAVIFHAQPRFTRDLDVFIKADSVNAQATYVALAEFGVALEGIRPEDFANRATFYRFGRDPRGFDILPDIPGVDFDAAWDFISSGDLVAAKLASGRPQDLADVDAIRKAAESQAAQSAKKKTSEPNAPD
ncbi:MAG: hypothetical protein WBW33_13280 [Bryobacteraceae bacterium]